MGKQVPNSSLGATDLPLAILNGKWKAAILQLLKEQPRRYSQLRASIPGLSDKMLTQRLHELVASGLVGHRRSASGPTGLYALTPTGRLLHGLLQDIRAWGRQHPGVLRAEGSALSRPATVRKRAR